MFGKNDTLVDVNFQASSKPASNFPDTEFGNTGFSGAAAAPAASAAGSGQPLQATTQPFIEPAFIEPALESAAPSFAADAPANALQSAYVAPEVTAVPAQAAATLATATPASPAPATAAGEAPAPAMFGTAPEPTPVPPEMSFSARFGQGTASAAPAFDSPQVTASQQGAPQQDAPQTAEGFSAQTQTFAAQPEAAGAAVAAGGEGVNDLSFAPLPALEQAAQALAHEDIALADGKTRVHAAALQILVQKSLAHDPKSLQQLSTHGFDLIEKVADGLAAGSHGLQQLTDTVAALVQEDYVVPASSRAQQTDALQQLAERMFQQQVAAQPPVPEQAQAEYPEPQQTEVKQAAPEQEALEHTVSEPAYAQPEQAMPEHVASEYAASEHTVPEHTEQEPINAELPAFGAAFGTAPEATASPAEVTPEENALAEQRSFAARTQEQKSTSHEGHYL